MSEATETPRLSREALDLLDARARAGAMLRAGSGGDAHMTPGFWPRLDAIARKILARKEADRCR